MQARMKHPVMIVPDVLPALQAASKAASAGGVPRKTLAMIHLRASQLNGCSFCTDMHARELREAGETDQRMWSIAAWREAPWFTDAERAVLALTEAVTRLDPGDPVPDRVWDEVTRHFDEPQLASIVLEIAMINFWTRLNVTVRQPAGARG
jgi:AhpD family alkylhydroperoxidase